MGHIVNLLTKEYLPENFYKLPMLHNVEGAHFADGVVQQLGDAGDVVMRAVGGAFLAEAMAQKKTPHPFGRGVSIGGDGGT